MPVIPNGGPAGDEGVGSGTRLIALICFSVIPGIFFARKRSANGQWLQEHQPGCSPSFLSLPQPNVRRDAPRWSNGFLVAVIVLVTVTRAGDAWAYELWFCAFSVGALLPFCRFPSPSYSASLRFATTHRTNWRANGLRNTPHCTGFIGSSALNRACQDSYLLLVGALFPVFCWVRFGRFGWRRYHPHLPSPSVFCFTPEHFLKDDLEPLLGIWTTDVAVNILKLAQYDVWYHNEYTIDSKRYYLIVNETCSGINLVVTLLMYTLVFGWFAQPSAFGRVCLTLAAFPGAHGQRAARDDYFSLGHYGGVEWADGFWHTGSAYVLFIPVFWLLYVVNNILLRRLTRRSNSLIERAHEHQEDGPQPPIAPTNE